MGTVPQWPSYLLHYKYPLKLLYKLWVQYHSDLVTYCTTNIPWNFSMHYASRIKHNYSTLPCTVPHNLFIHALGAPSLHQEARANETTIRRPGFAVTEAEQYPLHRCLISYRIINGQPTAKVRLWRGAFIKTEINIWLVVCYRCAPSYAGKGAGRMNLDEPGWQKWDRQRSWQWTKC